MMSLGVCPQNSNHQITQVHASREGYEEFCCKCRKWRRTIDLRPIRAEMRAMGVDPDEGVLAKRQCGEGKGPQRDG